MPLPGGETIGAAYVRLLLDGTGLPDAIRDEIDKAEPGIRAQGTRDGEAYMEEFSKSLDDLDFQGSLGRALGRNDRTIAFFEGPEWSDFMDRMQDEFGDAGALAATRFQNAFVKNGDLGKIDEVIEKQLIPSIHKATEDIAREERKVTDTVERENVTRLRLTMTTVQNMAALRKKEMDAFERDTARLFAESDRVSAQAKKVSQEMDDYFTRGAYRIRTSMQDADEQITKLFVNTRQLLRNDGRNGFITFARDIDKIGLAIGKAFGKGNRNDFLNFIGSMTYNMYRLISIVPRAIGVVGEFFGKIKDGVEIWQEGGRGFFESMKLGFQNVAAAEVGMVNSAAAWPVTLAAMVASVFVVIAALGPLAALLAMISGVLIALAGTVIFAVIGALGALAGALVPVVAGLAGMVLGIVGAIGQSKRFKEAFGPIVDDLKELRTELGNVVFDRFGDKVDEIREVLDRLGPTAVAITDEVAGSFERMLDRIANSPRWDRIGDKLAKTLPGLVGQVGDALTKVPDVLAGLFISLIPTVRRFLHWLNEVLGGWAKFLNSDDGQKKMRQFWRDTEESLKTIKDLIDSVVNLLGALFTNGGKDAGDSLIGSLADQIDKLATYVREHPDEVRNWFRDAEEFAKSLGGAIRSAAELIGELDTPENRRAVIVLINGISRLIGIFDWLVDKVYLTITALTELAHFMSGWRIPNPFKGLENSARNFPGLIISPLTNIPKLASGALAGLGTSIGGKFVSATSSATRTVETWVNSIGRLFGRVDSRISGATGTLGSTVATVVQKMVPILTPVSNAIDKLIGLFTAIPDRIRGALDGLGGIIGGIIADAIPDHITLPSVSFSGGGSSGGSDFRGGGGGGGGGGTSDFTGGGRTIINHWTITTPVDDPRAVASDLLDKMAVSGYGF